MNDTISIDGHHQFGYNSDSERFYKDYWKSGKTISEATLQRNQQFMQTFFDGNLSGLSILELGVGGEGGLIFSLKDENHVAGIDISLSAQRNCLQLGLDIELLNLDEADIPYDSKEFDLVFAFEVFEHFANPQHVIEEIRRVLKPTGELLVSLPNPYIHHWPRLFYPELFSNSAFDDFLRINNLVPVQKEGVGKHLYHERFQTSFEGAWNMVWRARNISDDDIESLFEQGMHFWKQKDCNGIRTKPIEAIDFFRRAAQNHNHYESQLALTCSLLYRYINGERSEFEDNLQILVKKVEQEGNAALQNLALFYFALTWIEMQRLHVEIIPIEHFNKVMSHLDKSSNAAPYIDAIHEELNSSKG